MLPGKKYTPADIYAIARRHFLVLVVPPVVTLFAALVYSASVPDIYEADVVISIVPQRVPDNIVQSTVTLKTEDRLGAITAEVTSRRVLEQIILEFKLYQDMLQRVPMDDVVKLMRADISTPFEAPRRGARGVEPAHAFHVKFKYSDPVVSARVTERLGALFINQNARDRGRLAEFSNEFLEQTLAEAKAQLEVQEHKLEAFRERYGNELPTQSQSNMQMIQSTQLQLQQIVERVAGDRNQKQALEKLYASMESEPALSGPTVAVAPGAERTLPAGATAQQQLEVARETLAGLEVRFKADWPEVRRQKRVVAELEAKAAAEAALTTTGVAPTPAISPAEMQRRDRMRQLRSDIQQLEGSIAFREKQEVQLRATMTEYQRRVEAVPGLESEYVALTRDYDTQFTAYKELLAKSSNAKVALDLETRQIGEQFRVLDSASVPMMPISPNRLQINGIGLAIGLLLGFALTALFEFRDTKFRSEGDVLDGLGLPVLATVPLVETPGELARRSRAVMIRGAVLASTVLAAGYVFWAMRLWSKLL